MPSTEILRIRNCIHRTNIIFSFRVMSRPVNLKIVGLKLVKLDRIIIKLDPNTIKKARNERDGACGLPLVSFKAT